MQARRATGPGRRAPRTTSYSSDVRRLRGTRPETPKIRRRERRGRGLRGPLAPPHVPVVRSRAEIFDDAVLDALERLERRWASELAGVQVLVEEVPPDRPDPTPRDVPLGRVEPAQRRRPARLVVYRRPVEARARDPRDLDELAQIVLTDLVADLLGADPRAGRPGRAQTPTTDHVSDD